MTPAKKIRVKESRVGIRAKKLIKTEIKPTDPRSRTPKTGPTRVMRSRATGSRNRRLTTTVPAGKMTTGRHVENVGISSAAAVVGAMTVHTVSRHNPIRKTDSRRNRNLRKIQEARHET